MGSNELELLRELCGKRGCRKDKQIAQKIGMDPTVLSRKFNGKSLFTIEEVRTFRTTFKLSNEDTIRIFLS